MKVPLKRCQHLLAVVWIIGSGLLFAIVFVQTTFHHFGDNGIDAWNWLLPTVVPTLSFIVTVLFSTSEPERKRVDRFLFRLSFSLSTVYLVTVLLVLVLQPFQSGITPTDALKNANIYLGPFQGIVASSLGIFFGKIQSGTPDANKESAA